MAAARVMPGRLGCVEVELARAHDTHPSWRHLGSSCMAISRLVLAASRQGLAGESEPDPSKEGPAPNSKALLSAEPTLTPKLGFQKRQTLPIAPVARRYRQSADSS
jgi:hypothetical protein